MRTLKFLFLFLFLLVQHVTNAQYADSIYASYSLEDVTVTAPRLPKAIDQVPFSITSVDSSLLYSERQALSIKEHLRSVPGVYIQNAYNFTQDTRISIRGFGATAAFGIRGIKLIVDGIPETTPDGTGQLDNLNLDLIGDLRVIRGAASSLYGNASGGAILVQSKFNFDKNFLESRSMVGSFGFYSQSFSGGMKLAKSVVTGHLRLFESQGFRNHSGFSQINSRVAVKHTFSDRLKATFLLEYVDSPKAQDAGGLTLEEAESDFKAARDRNVMFDAGEAITQWKVGASVDWILTEQATVTSYAFLNQRTFDGRLPFENAGAIALSRNYVGLGSSLNVERGIHTLKLGYDFSSQVDGRSRFDNVAGVRDTLRLNQTESFHNFDWFLMDYIAWGRWFISAGIRQDINWLEADDQFLADGDDSGRINLSNWNYQAGIGRILFPSIRIFANHSTSFETPTLNQLSNRTDNIGGFADLKPATASSFEAGLKWKRSVFSAELVGFRTKTRNELVPFELDEFPGRTFFRNSGSILRKGLEVSANYQSTRWKVFSSYTFSDFTFDDYVEEGQDLSGFVLPGIPKHHATLTFVAHPFRSLEIAVPFDYVGEVQADNQNEVAVDNYLEVNLMTKYTFTVGDLSIAPSFGIRNLTDQSYFDNIRINAFGGRYYEPAPGRNYYASVTMRIQ